MKIRSRLVWPGDDTRRQRAIRGKPFELVELGLDFLEVLDKLRLESLLLVGRDAGEAVIAEAATKLEPREQVGVEFELVAIAGLPDDPHGSSPQHVNAPAPSTRA